MKQKYGNHTQNTQELKLVRSEEFDRQKQAHGYLFVTADDTAVDVAKQKLYNLGKTELTTAVDAESIKFVSQFNAKSLL